MRAATILAVKNSTVPTAATAVAIIFLVKGTMTADVYYQCWRFVFIADVLLRPCEEYESEYAEADDPHPCTITNMTMTTVV